MATAVPSIRLIVPTPDASAYTEDGNSVSVSISPGAATKKKSVLGRVTAVQTPYNTVRGGVDFSDIVRRVGGAESVTGRGWEVRVEPGEGSVSGSVRGVGVAGSSSLRSAGGTWRAGDENWGGEGEGMVLIKKKAKTRGRVDGVFALADVTNANARPETPVEAKDKWWNLTRGRKDTGSGVLKGLVRRGKSPGPNGSLPPTPTLENTFQSSQSQSQCAPGAGMQMHLPGEPDCTLDMVEVPSVRGRGVLRDLPQQYPHQQPQQSKPFPAQIRFNSLGASSVLAPSPASASYPNPHPRAEYQRSVSAGSTVLLNQAQSYSKAQGLNQSQSQAQAQAERNQAQGNFAQSQQGNRSPPKYAHLPGASAPYATMTRAETYTQPAVAKSIPPRSPQHEQRQQQQQQRQQQHEQQRQQKEERQRQEEQERKEEQRPPQFQRSASAMAFYSRGDTAEYGSHSASTNSNSNNARPVEFKRSASALAVYSDAPAPTNANTNTNANGNAKSKPSEFQRTLVGSGILLGAPASTLGRAPTPAALSRAPTPVPGPRSGTPTMGGLLAPPGAVPLKDKEGQGSIAVRAMRSVRSMARLGGWEKDGENGKENGKVGEKEGEGREGEGTLRGKKKVKVKVKVKEEKVKEKDKDKDKEKKEKKEKGKRAPKSSGSSFEVGALGASPVQRKRSILGLGLGSSLGKGAGVSIGKSGGVSIGMGLPSALTLGRSNAAGGKASTASSVGGPAFVPNNAPATVNPNRLSAESAMNVKRASTNSSLRPLSVLSSGSSAGSRVSSGSSVRWAEEVVDRMRGRDRGEREKEKMEREKERERRKTERDSRRTSEGRKRTPLSDVFPGLSRRSSGAESANGLPMLTVEEATTDGHGHGDEEEENETGYEIVSATPVKRPRLRPVSDEVTNGRGKSRPRGIIEDSAADGVLNLLDAATNDLAQLITHLDLEATPGTPSPGRGPMVPRKEWEESPSKSRTLRPSDGSVSSLRPYAARGGSTTPSMLGKQIAPWPTASPPPAPAAAPTDATFKRMHRRTMTPTPEPDPDPVFHPLRLRPSRIRPVLSVTTSASASPPPPSDDQMQIDGRAPSSLTFGSRSSSGSVEDAEALRRARGLPPVFTRGHARNRSSLLPDAPSPKSSQGSTLGMPLAREAKRVLGMGGTMGGSAASGYEEQELDASDPDSDIPNELQAILSSCGQSPIDDTLSFRPPSVHAQLPSPGLPPHLPLPGSPSPASSPLPPHLQLPVLNIQLIDDEGHHGDIDETSSEEDTKKSFDFTGELQKLNESGASDRRSFVEQLENAFKTPAKLDLRGLLCVDVPPPMPAIPVTLKQDTSGSSTASSEQSSSGFQVPQSVSRLVDMKQPTMGSSSEEDSSEDVHMFSVSRIVDLKEPTLLPGSDSLASDDNLLPPRPFAAGPSDGQLNVKFKFGGELPEEEREQEKPKPMQSKKPLTLSDIIPPPAHVRSQSLSSLLEEDSSVLHSIFMHAAETAAEVPRPRVNSDSSTRGFMAENSRSSMASFHSRSRSRPQSGISFTGFDSFEEVRRGFEFHNNRPAFYPPPVTNTRRVPHARQDSLFSIASVSSYGHVTNPGAIDPFEYGLAMPSLRERPSSEDLSVSMSNFEDTFAFTRDPQRKRVASDASSFYFKAPGQPSARGHARRESNMSVSSQGPPNSFYNYNRSYASHRLSENDTSTSGSSLAHQYAAYGANGGRAAWAKHRQDSSVDSDHSVSRLGRPGVGEKMFARADHGMPLTAISASPTGSHSNRSSFDSILDEEQRSSMEDSLFEKTGHRSSMSGDSVFGDPNPYDHYRPPHGHLLPPNHFRPLSVLSFNNDHSPMKEDDTQIQMLGGGHVRRKSIGSMYDASPCVRVEKRKHVAFQEDDAPSKARVLTTQASIASTSSSKFGDERMIRATQGLLVRHSLEDTALQAEGEDLSAFRPAAVFFRPSPNSRSRSSTVTTSSSGAETPPLSPAEGSSMSEGSMSSIDIDMSQVNVMLSNATHPMSSTARDRVRARARGQGHRRRGSAAQTRASRSSRSSVYETIQEEFPSPPSSVGSKKSGSPTAHQGVWVVEADEAGSMDLSTGWDDERGIIALRRYYALRHEADDAVTESRRQFLDTPFSLYALQAFSPPKNPEGMQALLQHSVQNYGPLPSELGPRRVRSRTSSRASPYPRQGLIPASPEQQRSSPAVLHRLASSPLRPLEVNPNVDVHMSPVVLSPKRENAWGLAPNARPRVASATRRTALGWTRRSTKASTDLKENNTSMTGMSFTMTPGDSLRFSRPRPRGRPTPARAAPMPRQPVAAI